MIKAELISYETSELLSKFYINTETDTYYKINDDQIKYLEFLQDWSDLSKKNIKFYIAPTKELVKKWLRDIYKIHIEISISNYIGGTVAYRFKIISIGNCNQDFITYDNTLFNTYEEALEIAIQRTLKFIKNNYENYK